MGEGGEAVKCKNDARMLTGWIGDTKATNEERRSHKVTHPPHLELGPVMRIDPVAELLQHVAAKLNENRRDRFVSRRGPGSTRFAKKSNERPGRTVHMQDLGR